MAAAEARAAWQRTANRFFVQEDAKRAPKLACPSQTYPSSKSAEPGPADAPDGPENTNIGFMPLNRNSSYSDLPPENRWWLQIQPDYVHQKGLAHENDVPLVENKSEMGESYEFLEMDSIGSSASKKADDIGLNSDYSWGESRRSEPWWRLADGEELVSLVSQRSLDYIENCDLPRPQNRSIKRDPHDLFGKYDHAAKSQKNDDVTDKQIVFGSDNQSSDDTMRKSLNDQSEIDSTRVQLMEALRHSQTRAREAEKAAKQATAEKEHILQLFLKQASHLFAYKQWFQLLQLENIYFHVTNTNPVDLPFTPMKNWKLPKNRQKPPKAKKRAHGPEQDFGKFCVAFALGLGLVGAGLFLGWTVAWMLPAL